MNTSSFKHLHALRALQQCHNAETLTPAIHQLCSHFGAVKNLVVLTARHDGIKQAVCFLRLASEAQEQMLMKSLGAERFGGEIVIVVDLKANTPSQEIQSDFQWRFNNASSDMAVHAT
jgi:hypothetical protein